MKSALGDAFCECESARARLRLTHHHAPILPNLLIYKEYSSTMVYNPFQYTRLRLPPLLHIRPPAHIRHIIQRPVHPFNIQHQPFVVHFQV